MSVFQKYYGLVASRKCFSLTLYFNSLEWLFQCWIPLCSLKSSSSLSLFIVWPWFWPPESCTLHPHKDAGSSEDPACPSISAFCEHPRPWCLPSNTGHHGAVRQPSKEECLWRHGPWHTMEKQYLIRPLSCLGLFSKNLMAETKASQSRLALDVFGNSISSKKIGSKYGINKPLAAQNTLGSSNKVNSSTLIDPFLINPSFRSCWLVMFHSDTRSFAHLSLATY